MPSKKPSRLDYFGHCGLDHENEYMKYDCEDIF